MNELVTPMSHSGWWSAKRAWQVAAFALTLAAACWWLLAPIYQPQSSCAGGATSSGAEWSTCDPQTSILAAGAWGYIAWFCVLPVALAALPLAARGRQWAVLSVISSAALAAFAVLGVTLGLYFVAGAVCAIVGASLRRRRPVDATAVASAQA